MTEAKSTDPAKWVSHVADVSSPPGKSCSDYASCVKLIKAGTQVNFEGAGGNDDFNAHHNVFSGFAIEGFTPARANRQVGFVTGKQIAANGG